VREFSARSRVAVVLLIGTVLLAACGSSGNKPSAQTTSSTAKPPSGPSVKIGVQGALSGALSYLGTPVLSGAKTAAYEINAGGGVDNHPIEIFGQDDRADVPTETRIFQDFISQGAVAVIGPGNSGGWTAISPIAQEQKVPLLTTNNPKPMDPAQPYLFNEGVDSTRAAQVSFAFIDSLAKKANKDKPKIGTLTLNTASGAQLKASTQAEAKKRGWDIVSEQVAEIQLTDFSSGAAAFAQAKPDFIYADIIPAQIPVVLAAVRSRGLDVPIVNYSFGAYNYVFEQAKDKNYFAYRDFVDPTDPDVSTTKKLGDLAKAAGEDAHLKDGFGFSMGYSMVKYIAAALKTCGYPCSGEKLNTALEGIKSFDAQQLAAPGDGYSSTRHEFAPKVKWYGWDGAKGRVVSVSDWIG
jgi:branched-chain amino acid transport system substrate-binding protein